MRWIALLLPFLAITSCRHKAARPPAARQDSTAMHAYFPFIEPRHRKDSLILEDMASHLPLYDEHPLNPFNPAGPEIRFYYQPAFNQWRMIKIQQQELVVKSAWPHQDGFYYSDQPDPSLLSDGQRNQLRVLAAYHVLVDSKHPDTAAFLKTYHWLPYEQQLMKELRHRMRVYGTGRISYTVEKRHSAPVILQDLVNQVYRSGYWRLPVNNNTKGGITDGSTWRLEVAAHGQHHLVYDRSPDTGAFYALGRRILQYAAIPDREIY